MDKVVHFEIPADDPKRAQKFYQKVFDWRISPAPDDMPYWMISTVETDQKTMMPKEACAINGGIYKRDRQSARSPVVVVNVSSVDKYVKRIKDAGGKVTREKIQVGDMGYYAQVQDTEGNIIGIWETIPRKR